MKRSADGAILAKCWSQIHPEDVDYSSNLVQLSKAKSHEDIQILVRHGDLDAKKIARADTGRKIWICTSCLELARSGNSLTLSDTLNDISKLVEKLSGETVIKNTVLETKLINIITVLLRTQDKYITEECDLLYRSKKDHESVKNLSDERTFLKSDDRNNVLLQILMSFCKIDNLETASEAKITSLCCAYENILNTRDKRVVTCPALSKNFRFIKQTHSRSLFNLVAHPSGGGYKTVQSLATSELPELYPPSGDFISTDDNLQVKNICASRNLRENFKFSVKVVDNHSYFQTEEDVSTSILKHDENRPTHWMKTPTVAEVSEFEEKIEIYEKSAKKVRVRVLDDWLNEEINSTEDLVTKLNYLRSTREEGDLWPCYNCESIG